MKFLNPDKLKGEVPDFSEEGWARRRPKKKK
jgi:ATP-dependent RNA helicase DeaD